MLDRHQIAELADDGLAIGAHGHRHVALDAVDPADRPGRDPPQPGPARGLDRAPRDRVRLPPRLPRPAAPRPRSTAAGFTSACAVKQALSSPTDDPFALARIMPTGT